MTRILVTGANGHLGSNIVRRLLRQGHDIVPFVRRTSDLQGLEGLGLTYAYGDILDETSLRRAAEGCEVIIHAAAVYRFYAPRAAAVIEPAVVGTRNVVAAGQAVGVRRLVVTSSTFAVGSSPDPGRLMTAADWNDWQHMPYTRAKVAAERTAWRCAEAAGIPMIALCPNGILGPYDYRLTPTMALLRNLVNGVGVTNRGGVGFVDVRDVAEIHARAVSAGEPGQRYLITGEHMTMKEFGAVVARLTGVTPRHIGAGPGVVQFVAGLMELAARVTGGEPMLTRAMAREVIDRYHYYADKATRRTFGVVPRPGEAMVADSLRWLLYRGAIRPRVARGLATRLPPDPRWQAALD